MSESTRANSASPPPHCDFQRPTKRTETKSWLSTTFFVTVFPLAVAVLLYRLEPFDPVHLPADKFSRRGLTFPASNSQMRRGSEEMAKGEVAGPEDLVYDAAKGMIYTGCVDGWIKRVTVNDSVVENWVNTGGRPLGLALSQNGELIVADSYKGLLRVTSDKKIELLADEVEGLKFKLTDGVDVADDGTIYFTDASYKYTLKDSYFDVLEGKPHGRFMSYNPATKKTTLLARNLYFPNGAAVSPDQHFVVFCETVLSRCRKYYIKGPKNGSIDKFCDDIPGIPDNIHYDGQGHYWIAISTSLTYQLDLTLRYPFIRKAAAIIAKYIVLRTGKLVQTGKGAELLACIQYKITQKNLFTMQHPIQKKIQQNDIKTQYNGVPNTRALPTPKPPQVLLSKIPLEPTHATLFFLPVLQCSRFSFALLQ